MFNPAMMGFNMAAAGYGYGYNPCFGAMGNAGSGGGGYMAGGGSGGTMPYFSGDNTSRQQQSMYQSAGSANSLGRLAAVWVAATSQTVVREAPISSCVECGTRTTAARRVRPATTIHCQRSVNENRTCKLLLQLRSIAETSKYHKVEFPMQK